MPKHRIIRTAFAALALLASTASFSAQTVQAPTASPPQSYSATAIHALPGQPETTGKIVKSGQNLRLEFEQNGKPVIQILRPADGLMYVLDPTAKTYVEIRGPAVPATTTEGYTSPCPDQPPLARCTRTGKDTVSGISVERWELAARPDDPPLVILWDSTRRRALRQEFPDGRVLAMAFKAMEDVDGRKTEHWSIQVTAPDQPANTGSWWFDPELRVVVREDMPGGEIRRLENIETGPVDPAAFMVPQGWTRQDTPTGN